MQAPGGARGRATLFAVAAPRGGMMLALRENVLYCGVCAALAIAAGLAILTSLGAA